MVCRRGLWSFSAGAFPLSGVAAMGRQGCRSFLSSAVWLTRALSATKGRRWRTNREGLSECVVAAVEMSALSAVEMSSFGPCSVVSERRTWYGRGADGVGSEGERSDLGAEAGARRIGGGVGGGGAGGSDGTPPSAAAAEVRDRGRAGHDPWAKRTAVRSSSENHTGRARCSSRSIANATCASPHPRADRVLAAIRLSCWYA